MLWRDKALFFFCTSPSRPVRNVGPVQGHGRSNAQTRPPRLRRDRSASDMRVCPAGRFLRPGRVPQKFPRAASGDVRGLEKTQAFAISLICDFLCGFARDSFSGLSGLGPHENANRWSIGPHKSQKILFIYALRFALCSLPARYVLRYRYLFLP